MRAAFVHDALYQLMRLKLITRNYRAYTDRLFHTMLKQDGMFCLRAWYWYRAVKKCGSFATNPKNAKKELIAP